MIVDYNTYYNELMWKLFNEYYEKQKHKRIEKEIIKEVFDK